MKLFLLLGLMLSLNAFSFEVNGVRCKDMPKNSCERKKCRCLRGVHRASKGKQVKRKTNKKGKPTPEAFCADHGSDGEAAWKAFLQTKPKLSQKCK